MPHIVRVIAEDTFAGPMTSFVGPFEEHKEAEAYADAHNDPDQLIECFVEPLYSPEGA